MGRLELARRSLAECRALAGGAREGKDWPPGARVATLMASSVAYVCADQATLALGLAIVPLHATDNPGNLRVSFCGDSEASALITDSPEYWARLAPEVAFG